MHPRRDTIRSDARWNSIVNLADGAVYSFGITLVSQQTVLPLLVSQLSSSRWVVGLIPAIFSLGTYLPQLLTANLAERRQASKWFIVSWGLPGQRLPYLLIGLSVLCLAKRSPQLALAAILALFGVSCVTLGALMPPYYDVIAKVIPVRARGLYSGLRGSMGAGLGIVGGLLGGRILDGLEYPLNYAVCFGIAFVCQVIAQVGFMLTREPATTITRPATSLSRYLQRLPSLLATHRNYARFLVARAVSSVGGMATGFVAVYCASRFHMATGGIGTLTAILVGSEAVINFVWGTLGDRQGHKSVLVGGAVSMALACMAAHWATSASFVWLIFPLLGASLGAELVSGTNIILEFAPVEERPTYLGLTNTLLSPVRALAPFVGGWLATWLDYRGMFLVATLAACVGAALLALWVREPRRAAQAETRTTLP